MIGRGVRAGELFGGTDDFFQTLVIVRMRGKQAVIDVRLTPFFFGALDFECLLIFQDT